jgi:hypothetical protein
MDSVTLGSGYVATGAYPFNATCTACGSGKFHFRPGPGKRAITLLKEGRPLASVRTGLSMLYARYTTKSRINAMRAWSVGLVTMQSDLRRSSVCEPGNAAVLRVQIERLLAMATAGVAKETRAEIFEVLAGRLCRGMGDAHLAALHGVLAQGAVGSHPDGISPWADDAVGMAGHLLSQTVDRELALRTISQPLSEIGRLAKAGASMESMDRAFVALAVRLHRVGDPETAQRWLQCELERGSDDDLRVLGELFSDVPGRDGIAPRARFTQALAGIYLSPDLRRQREHFLHSFHARVRACAQGRMDQMVEDVRADIAAARSTHRSAQSICEMAASRLHGMLYSQGGYHHISRDFAPDRLLPGLLARAVAEAADPGFDLDGFMRDVDANGLSQLRAGVSGMASWGTLPRAVRREWEDRWPSALRAIDERQQALRASVASGDRWAAANALRDLAAAVGHGASLRSAFRQEWPAEAASGLRAAVLQAVDGLFRSPADAAGPLGQASLSRLSDEEVQALRQSAPHLAPFGLSIADDAIQACGKARSEPYIDLAVRHARALMNAVAHGGSDAGPLLESAVDCVEQVIRARTIERRFLGMETDGGGTLAADILARSVQQLEDRGNDKVGAARAQMRPQTRPQAQMQARLQWSARALEEIATSLHSGLDSDGMDPASHPASLAADRMRLGAKFVLEAAARTHGGSAVTARPQQPGKTVLAETDRAWKASFRQALVQQFGVASDPECTRGYMVMGPAEYQKFQESLTYRIPVGETTSWTIETPAGPLPLVVPEQFKIDGIDRPSVELSVRGADRQGNAIERCDSARRPGETSHHAGVDRALSALYRLAGEDTAQIMAYMTQTVAGGWAEALQACGANSPLKLSDGHALFPGGAGNTEVDVTRCADGSYLLATTLTFPEIGSGYYMDDKGDPIGVTLDPTRSFASLSYQTRLRLTSEGGQSVEMTAPVAIRYRFIETEPAAAKVRSGNALSRLLARQTAHARSLVQAR